MRSFTELRAKSECLERRCEIVIDYGFQKENGSQSEWRMKKMSSATFLLSSCASVCLLTLCFFCPNRCDNPIRTTCALCDGIGSVYLLPISHKRSWNSSIIISANCYKDVNQASYSRLGECFFCSCLFFIFAKWIEPNSFVLPYFFFFFDFIFTIASGERAIRIFKRFFAYSIYANSYIYFELELDERKNVHTAKKNKMNIFWTRFEHWRTSKTINLDKFISLSLLALPKSQEFVALSLNRFYVCCIYILVLDR